MMAWCRVLLVHVMRCSASAWLACIATVNATSFSSNSRSLMPLRLASLVSSSSRSRRPPRPGGSDWRCKDDRLEILERCIAALECGLHRLELSLEEALLDTGCVGHLQETLLEPGLIGSDLRGERVELAGQLAR